MSTKSNDRDGLRLFEIDEEYVIAANAEDARVALHEQRGGDLEDIDPEEIHLHDDEHKLTIWCDVDLSPDEPHGDGNSQVTMAAYQWVRLRGRGYLASENT